MPDQFISYPSPSTNAGSPPAARPEADVDQSVWPSEPFLDPVDFGQYGLFDPEFEQQIASLMYTDLDLPQPQVPYYPPQSDAYAQNAFIMAPASSETTQQTAPAYAPTNTFYPALFSAQPTPLPSPPSQPRQRTQLPPLTTSIPWDTPAFLPSPPPSGLPRQHVFQHQQQLQQPPQQSQQQFVRPASSVAFPPAGLGSRQITAPAAGEPQWFALPVPGDLPGSGCEVIM